MTFGADTFVLPFEEIRQWNHIFDAKVQVKTPRPAGKVKIENFEHLTFFYAPDFLEALHCSSRVVQWPAVNSWL